MKKIGEYTAKGQFTSPDTGGAEHMINLFDGRFDTAYKIIKFEIMTQDPIFNNIEYTAKLTTQSTTSRLFNWANNDQIAWAFGEDTITGFKSVVDPDNMVVEDLFVYAATSSSTDINYMITMEKYEINDWRGALAMVRNSSQAD
jgi:hypothetical protein